MVGADRVQLAHRLVRQLDVGHLKPAATLGIRYDERLEQDMIALPIGPRVQRFASGALTAPREFERNGEVLKVEPTSRLVVRIGGATDLAVDAAVGGAGVIHLFEDWLVPHFASGALEPVLNNWSQPFSGPFLYHSQRRLVPPPLRASVDYVRAPG